MIRERMGEIALALLVAKSTADGGIKIGPEWRRICGQLSKDTGISQEELDEFSKEILVLFIGKAYGVRRVSLTLSDPIPKKEPEKK